MSPWLISYRHYDRDNIRLRESILTLGNGYFATRGAETDGLSSSHYPATYMAGAYNRLSSQIKEMTLVNEDLVNFPNWLPIIFKVAGEEWLDIDRLNILSYCQLLHFKKGLLRRCLRVEDNNNRIFTILSLRFVSQHNPHLAGIRYSITSENWEGQIVIRSSMKANICNNGVARYKALNNKHLEILQKGMLENNGLYLQTRTSNSHLECAQVTSTELYRKKTKLSLKGNYSEDDEGIYQEFTLDISPFEKISVIKLLSIYNSKDHGSYENLYQAKSLLNSTPSMADLVAKHCVAWKQLWYMTDIELGAPSNEQLLVRLHIFHTLQCLSKHSINLDYGVPARGLHGEAYRGHVFWDEIYILPFYFFHFPDIARSLLLYRYHRLDAARKLAKEAGYDGAMFPWQSGSNGEEETQKYHLNPLSDTWGPDYSSRQRHVNLSIVYNIWHYFQCSADFSFLQNYGAEMIFEIAKFISSLTSFNPIKKKYEIINVMGPDEYHEHYPNSNLALANNSYTNIMAVWCLEKALKSIELLGSVRIDNLFQLLNISQADVIKWEKITHNLFIPFHDKVISQFEGYEQLDELDWTEYNKNYSNIKRMDRILKAQKKDPSTYKIAKQPDTLMLFYLFDEQEIKRILDRLGYLCPQHLITNTINYYLARTTHGSTLSHTIFASIFFQRQPQLAFSFLREALSSDINDSQGGTTGEGIHLGMMTGTAYFFLKDVAGISIINDLLQLKPQLPYWLKRLKFKLSFKANLYEIEIFPTICYIQVLENNLSMPVLIYDELVNLEENNRIRFCLFNLK